MHAYGLHMNALIVVKQTCMHAINIALMHACILHMNAFINWVASVKIDWVGDEHYNASFVFIVMFLFWIIGFFSSGILLLGYLYSKKVSRYSLTNTFHEYSHRVSVLKVIGSLAL